MSSQNTLKTIQSISAKIVAFIPSHHHSNRDTVKAELLRFPTFGSLLQLLQQLFEAICSLNPKMQQNILSIFTAPFCDASSVQSQVLERSSCSSVQQQIILFVGQELPQLDRHINSFYKSIPTIDQVEE